MKNIKLLSINYHNFKGIKEFTFKPEGESITISGANATGKTTLFDGFTWLLFGKNSDDVKQFNPKPLHTDGTEQLGLDPEVTATLEVDGEEVELSRKLAEKWITPRGKAEKERKSDVTELTINNVPKKVKEFSEYINGLIDEDNFKMITNPFAFNNLKWQERREILVSLVSDVSDDEVIKKVSDPDALRKLLDSHTPDDTKAMIGASRKNLKKEIDGLPARVDEATRAIPQASDTDEATLKAMLTEYQKAMAEAQQVLNLAGTDNLNLDARATKAKLQSDYSDAQSSYLQGNQMALSGLMDDISSVQQTVNDKRSKLYAAKGSLSQAETALEVANTKHEELTKKYKVLSKTSFNEDELVCPTCGQELQPDKQDEIRKHFNVEKSNSLAAIAEDGQQSNKDVNMAKNEIKAQQQIVESLQGELDQVQSQLDSLNNDYNQTKATQLPFEQTSKGESLQKAIDEQQAMIDNGSGNSSKARAIAQEKVDKIQAGIDQVKGELGKAQQIKQQQERVEELHTKEDELKETYAALDKQSFLLDQYTRTKVTMLEEKINKLFKFVSFKLFEVQKNGEINEVCEAMVDGVPFSTDLNNAARINAGLDIINTLSNHYQVVAPIFIDNAESVNQIADTEAQQIALVVSNDKELTVTELTEKEVA